MKNALEKGRIGSRQLAILIIFMTVGDSILILPSLTARAASQDAWISAIAGCLLALPMLWLWMALAGRYPQSNLAEYARGLLGKRAGGFVSLYYSIYFFFVSTGLIRELGDFFTIQIMPETPLRAVHLLILLVIAWGLAGGLEAIVRTSELFFPWFILLLLALLICLTPLLTPDNLKPMLSEGVSPILHGSLYVLVYPFAELVSLLMVFPYVARSRSTKRDILLAASIGGLIMFTVILFSLMVLGSYLTSNQVYPTYALAKKINIGSFLQRVEAVVAFVWVLSTFFKTSIHSYAFLLGIAETFKLRSYRRFIGPFVLLQFGLTYLITPNFAFYTDVLFKYWPFWDLTNAVLLPLVLLLAHSASRKRTALKA
ncbi:GerAB/ArcD/ProY family transporter [Cohnella thailandensis]|uniref:Endospore germination permease n=1 Tax=Cohnella thailandensis TaxID=557557 RepID=A0A841T4R7_9BACL|nr:endospore germination permease [Cohnella thailandensis]MBB6637328.1 endospore germination permease [Cohnella thailandensis]MBP1976656.1 spore germination protein KB [Cohnella thailandensis]